MEPLALCNDAPLLAPPPVAAGAAIAQPALLHLGHWLRAQAYAFACPTPATHQQWVTREPAREARSLRDVFGWNLPFSPALLPERALRWLRDAGALHAADGRLRCGVRFSTISGRMFLHSGHPTQAQDAVFLGPDTHRFAAFVQAALAEGWPHPVRQAVDIGCGTGAGAILATDRLDTRTLEDWRLRDINPRALSYAAVNVRLNGLPCATLETGDALHDVDARFDLVIANPPYLLDPEQRWYRDGGGTHGTALALRFLHDALEHLAPGGRVLLYTGTPVIDGEDVFWHHARPLLQAAPVHFDYRELDPDVHGQSLSQPGYEAVERIAAVGLRVMRAGGEP